jgi:hypothetical protein
MVTTFGLAGIVGESRKGLKKSFCFCVNIMHLTKCIGFHDDSLAALKLVTA